ncbi:MAG: hypothetical protein IAF02_06790, partial [Anaerolineae bacterium]|nr:hypothetical protein [Anaerolineae bacterium]
MLSQFKWFLSSPVFPDDPDKTAVARIIHVFTLLTAAVIIVIAPFLIIVSGEIAPNLLWSVGSILGLMGTSYLAQKGYIQQASWLVLAVLWFIGLLTFMTAGGVQAPGYVLWLVIILLAGILLGWRVSLGVTILTALAGLLFLWMANQGVLPNSSLPDNNFRVWLF